MYPWPVKDSLIWSLIIYIFIDSPRCGDCHCLDLVCLGSILLCSMFMSSKIKQEQTRNELLWGTLIDTSLNLDLYSILVDIYLGNHLSMINYRQPIEELFICKHQNIHKSPFCTVYLSCFFTCNITTCLILCTIGKLDTFYGHLVKSLTLQ